MDLVGTDADGRRDMGVAGRVVRGVCGRIAAGEVQAVDCGMLAVLSRNAASCSQGEDGSCHGICCPARLSVDCQQAFGVETHHTQFRSWWRYYAVGYPVIMLTITTLGFTSSPLNMLLGPGSMLPTSGGSSMMLIDFGHVHETWFIIFALTRSCGFRNG